VSSEGWSVESGVGRPSGWAYLMPHHPADLERLTLRRGDFHALFKDVPVADFPTNFSESMAYTGTAMLADDKKSDF